MGLGVNVHFSSLADANAEIASLATVGFRFVRIDLLWSLVEQQKGHYDFSSYQRIMSTLVAHTIRPIFILDYNNSLYDNTSSPPLTEVGLHTDEARQAFGRFAAAAVTTFKDYGVLWEIWNEPDNPRFWYPQPNPDSYMALTQITINAMRSADASATIVAPALVGLEPTYQDAWKFLERCFQLGLLDVVDALSVHSYRLGPPETASADYHHLRTLITRYATQQKVNIPIVCSEWGYSLTWVSQEQQAAYFVRLFLINLANNLPLSIWYDWRDDGSDAKQIEDNFGIVTWNNQPKIAYFAAQTLIQQLTGFRFTEQVSVASTADYALLFTNGTAKKQVLWTTNTPHTISLPVNQSSVTVTTMTGEQHSLSTTNGMLSLQLTNNPQYLTLNEA